MRRSARHSARSDATPGSLILSDEDVSGPTAYTPDYLSSPRYGVPCVTSVNRQSEWDFALGQGTE